MTWRMFERAGGAPVASGGLETHVKLPKRSVNHASAVPGRRAMVFDTEIPGFALRITENGVKTFVLRH